MKILIYTIVAIFSCTTLHGQSNWTRPDKEQVYNECQAYLSANYKQLNEKQKEDISICYLEEFTKKNTKEDYHSMIEPVLKRTRSAIINECAKNRGVELNAIMVSQVVAAKPKDDVPTKENLVGHWKEKSEEREFDLSAMGTFTMVYEGKRTTGKWQLDGMKLTMFFDRLFGSKERVYDIEIFKEDNFGYTNSKGSFYNVVRVK